MRIGRCERADEVLRIVEAEFAALNAFNVTAAFSRLAKLPRPKSGWGSALQALLARAEDVLESMQPRRALPLASHRRCRRHSRRRPLLLHPFSCAVRICQHRIGSFPIGSYRIGSDLIGSDRFRLNRI